MCLASSAPGEARVLEQTEYPLSRDLLGLAVHHQVLAGCEPTLLGQGGGDALVLVEGVEQMRRQLCF